MEVEVLVTIVLVEAVQVLNVAGIGVWVGKSELSLMIFVPEGKLEYHLEFTRLSQNQWTFGRDAVPVRPLASGKRPFTIDWSVTFRGLVLNQYIAT